MSQETMQKLLVVEDNAGDARLLEEMLHEQTGHAFRLFHVENLREAEEYIEQNAVDIVLLDLGLPDAQGLEGVRKIRALAPHVPLIVLTGLDDATLATSALHEGAQDYLVKDDIECRGLLRAMRHAKERKVMEDALVVEKERAEVTLNCIGDAVACTDSNGNITFINRAAEEMVGWSLKEVFGRSIIETFPILYETSHGTRALDLHRDSGIKKSHDRVLICKNETLLPIEDSSSAIYDRRGMASGAVVVLRDVTATRKMAREMVYSAQHDHLTGLPNRLLLHDRIRHAIARAQRDSKHVALLFLDMDGFKHVNDSLGHSVGDKMLQSIARRLLDSVRPEDTVSRQGGDEFIVLLTDIGDPIETAQISNKILRAIAESHDVGDHQLHITTSIGVSIYPDDGSNAETLIQNADTAMYQAKGNSRHSYRYFTPEMNRLAVERQTIEEALRRALERNEFVLQYQPKVNILTGMITGAEALVRWEHPVRGMVPPGDFIPIAEDCGLIVPIGRWVLRQACSQVAEWLRDGLQEIKIAVNVSASEFRQEGFLEDVSRVLAEFELPHRLLELELTEGVLIKHSESTKSILERFRALGVRVALDDFGTGFSSLSYLTQFPLDALKIDQSFVRQITSSQGEAPIVNAVLGIGKSLNLNVIAEGVETGEQLSFLRQHGCDEAQGYLFSRPVAPDRFAELLKLEAPFSSPTRLR